MSRGPKSNQNSGGHMTKMVSMAITVKTFKNLLRNQMADIIETWYTVFGTHVQLMTLS